MYPGAAWSCAAGRRPHTGGACSVEAGTNSVEPSGLVMVKPLRAGAGRAPPPHCLAESLEIGAPVLSNLDMFPAWSMRTTSPVWESLIIPPPASTGACGCATVPMPAPCNGLVWICGATTVGSICGVATTSAAPVRNPMPFATPLPNSPTLFTAPDKVSLATA
ncbi:MAG: hypothetical protein WC107_07715 [Patescibacteria group bacterium]